MFARSLPTSTRFTIYLRAWSCGCGRGQRWLERPHREVLILGLCSQLKRSVRGPGTPTHENMHTSPSSDCKQMPSKASFPTALQNEIVIKKTQDQDEPNRNRLLSVNSTRGQEQLWAWKLQTVDGCFSLPCPVLALK